MMLQTSGLATKQLRAEATALGMDCSWCLERSELLEAFKRAKQVCFVVRPALVGTLIWLLHVSATGLLD
jgi:hypothetical protein